MDDSSREIINIITGPGHHDKMVIEALRTKGANTISFYYWPKFYIKYNDQIIIPLVGKIYNIGTLISYALRSRLLKWFRFHWAMDHLFDWYDYLVSKSLSGTGRLLIGWPQVSFYSFERWKKSGGICVLEHPMIHVNEWMMIMQEAYQGLPEKKLAHSLFTKQMQRRMLKEYQLADRINVLSSYAYETFVKHGVPKDKLSITKLGIDTNLFSIKSNAYPIDRFVFLFVGRLEVLKGVHLLVDAFNSLQLPIASSITSPKDSCKDGNTRQLT